MKRRRTSLAGVVGAVLLGVALSGTAATAERAVAKPVIGSPTALPTQPVAGKQFTVAFNVTRSDTGARLVRGRMICDPSIAGRVIRHTESFANGTARLSMRVPVDAAGKQLKVRVTIATDERSATKVATFRVVGMAKPSLSVADVAAPEGSAGTTTLSFPVTLSTAATTAVSVDYATTDGTATAPADYTAAKGTLTFQPGEKVKPIQISVAGDIFIEPDETLTVTLSNPVNATVADGTATGTIANDDVAVPVTPGSYRGAEGTVVGSGGNAVFFTVLPSRMVTGFRTNSVTENCRPGGYLQGWVDWGTKAFAIGNDGSFTAIGNWSGSDKQGDTEWTNQSWQVTGLFNAPASASGTFVLTDELNYKGTHYTCSTGTITWWATLTQ